MGALSPSTSVNSTTPRPSILGREFHRTGSQRWRHCVFDFPWTDIQRSWTALHIFVPGAGKSTKSLTSSLSCSLVIFSSQGVLQTWLHSWYSIFSFLFMQDCHAIMVLQSFWMDVFENDLRYSAEIYEACQTSAVSSSIVARTCGNCLQGGSALITTCGDLAARWWNFVNFCVWCGYRCERCSFWLLVVQPKWLKDFGRPKISSHGVANHSLRCSACCSGAWLLHPGSSFCQSALETVPWTWDTEALQQSYSFCMTTRLLVLFVEAVHPSFSCARKAAEGTPAASSVASCIRCR